MSNEKNIAVMSAEAASAVERFLVETGGKLAEASEEVKTYDIAGSTYAVYRGSMQRITPHDFPEPDAVEVFSLQGLVDFIKADVDGFFAFDSERHIVRVSDEKTVEVLSKAIGYNRKRSVRVRCRAKTPNIRLNMSMNTDQFQVMLQTCFEQSDNRDTVMRIAGTVSKEQAIRKSDDGMKQTVQIETGVATKQDVTFKNPVALTPIRTFLEIEQPSSPFILRFDDDANAALYEGDGGAWKLAAVARIAAWLRANLDGLNVDVIA